MHSNRRCKMFNWQTVHCTSTAPPAQSLFIKSSLSQEQRKCAQHRSRNVRVATRWGDEDDSTRLTNDHLVPMF